MVLVVAFGPSHSLMCLAAMIDYEYDVSFSVQSLCFRCAQMQLFAWAHVGKVVGIFSRFNHIRHLLPLLVRLLTMGYGRSATLLLVETNLWGGLIRRTSNLVH